MMRMKSDLVALCPRGNTWRIESMSVRGDSRCSLVLSWRQPVILISMKKALISGLQIRKPEPEATKVFHAGTQLRNDVLTQGAYCVTPLWAHSNGGLKLPPIPRWKNLLASAISRKDIGYRAIARKI